MKTFRANPKDEEFRFMTKMEIIIPFAVIAKTKELAVDYTKKMVDDEFFGLFWDFVHRGTVHDMEEAYLQTVSVTYLSEDDE